MHSYSFFLFFLSFPLNIFVSFIFIALFPNGNPLQYSCLENPMDRGAWKAAVHGVAEGRARLSDFTFTFHFCALEKEMATHSCSCLENPRDAGAWWAAVYGVAQSQTRLKRLSSSSIPQLAPCFSFCFPVCALVSFVLVGIILGFLCMPGRANVLYFC